MRIADVVNRLKTSLPNYTGLFCDIVSVSSVIASGGVATITTTTPHGLSTGREVTVSNVATRTPINSVLKDGLIYTFTTLIDHDLTFGWDDHNRVELGGFTDIAWNTEFDLKSSNNRREFTINSANSIPTLNGNEYLLELNRVDGIDGNYGITVINTTTFTVNGDFNDGVYTPINGVIYSNPRIAATIDIDRAIDEYTKYNSNQFWLMVEPVNVDISKDRSTFSDATNTIANGNDMRTRMIDGFTAYIIAPTSQEIAGEVALDICRHDLLLPMMKSLYGFQFATGTSNQMDFKTTLKSHGVTAYDRAYLVYSYEFEVVVDLTNDDAVDDKATRAFRNIDYTQSMGGDDTTDMTVSDIDLDIQPI